MRESKVGSGTVNYDNGNAEEPERIDISTFNESNKLIEEFPPLVMQLKGFNRKERLDRRNIQVTKSMSGSLSSRAISPGAIMLFRKLPISETLDVHHAENRLEIADSRGMYINGDREVFFGSVDTVYSWDLSKDHPVVVSSSSLAPLAFIHSIDLYSNERKLLVTSSGLDRILEVNIVNGRSEREWIAYENGFNRAKFSGKLVFSHEPEVKPDEPYVVVGDDIIDKKLGLPPAERTAFPNGAIYLDSNYWLVTMYHHGLAKIDITTGQVSVIDSILNHPHSPIRWNNGYIVTNTGSGQGVFYDELLRLRTILDFSNLDGLDTDANNRQWIQHVQPIDSTHVLAVDSNRVCIHFLDLSKKLRQSLPMNPNWVVQEVRPVLN